MAGDHDQRIAGRASQDRDYCSARFMHVNHVIRPAGTRGSYSLTPNQPGEGKSSETSGHGWGDIFRAKIVPQDTPGHELIVYQTHDPAPPSISCLSDRIGINDPNL